MNWNKTSINVLLGVAVPFLVTATVVFLTGLMLRTLLNLHILTTLPGFCAVVGGSVWGCVFIHRALRKYATGLTILYFIICVPIQFLFMMYLFFRIIGD